MATELSATAKRLGFRPLAAVLAVLGATMLVIYLLGVRNGSPGPIELPPANSDAAAALTGAAGISPGGRGGVGADIASELREVVVVHIDGEVVTPGVYEIESPARLEHLVQLAGGLTPQADTTRINLAQLLNDSDRLVVPTVGQPLPEGVSSIAETSSGAKININTASAQQLTGLNGIGPVLAANIIKYRSTHGPFASVDVLSKVSGIGAKTVEGLREQATS